MYFPSIQKSNSEVITNQRYIFYFYVLGIEQLALIMRFHLCLITLSLLGVTHGEDEFRFAHHYADNMVLQRAPLNAVVWGYREDQQPVNVLIRGPNMIKHATVEGILVLLCVICRSIS